MQGVASMSGIKRNENGKQPHALEEGYHKALLAVCGHFGVYVWFPKRFQSWRVLTRVWRSLLWGCFVMAKAGCMSSYKSARRKLTGRPPSDHNHAP